MFKEAVKFVLHIFSEHNKVCKMRHKSGNFN